MFKKGDKVFYNGIIPEQLGDITVNIMEKNLEYFKQYYIIEIAKSIIFGQWIRLKDKDDMFGNWWFPYMSFNKQNIKQYMKKEYDLI